MNNLLETSSETGGNMSWAKKIQKKTRTLEHDLTSAMGFAIGATFEYLLPVFFVLFAPLSINEFSKIPTIPELFLFMIVSFLWMSIVKESWLGRLCFENISKFTDIFKYG